ncbi:ABC transporter substrate-binding protein (plasmid) [Methylobacterium sp. NMS12]|uniref:ABC transporter substrate-binding protein n=1 Tax=Methylobacterium sp. NMS12 TaxID=3079766 RepID=UPI003F885613
MIVNLEPEPSSFLFNAQTAGVLAAQVIEGLIEYDEHFKPRSALAERWDISPDGRTATFHLRPGVTWHDGKPFTAADVRYTVEAVIKTVNPRAAAAFKLVEAVETPDPLTVTFRLSEPSPALWSILSSAEAGILPRHLYEGTPPLENPWNRKLVGTGPFVFKEWVRGDFVLLERNPRYWRENRPYLDRIRFKTITDPGAREAALEAGEVHYTPFSVVPPSDVERLRSVPGLRVETRGYGTFVPVFFLDFNMDRPRLRDKRVRAAFAHAIDRQALADRVWYGLARPATGPIPSTQVEFYTADTTQYAFDPKRAEALLDEAGLPRGPDGVRLRLDHYAMPYGDVLRRAAEFIKEQLRQVGVELTLVNLDLAPFLRKIYGDRDFDTYSTYYSASADPQIGVVRRYWSKAILKNVAWSNGPGYANPVVDRLIEASAVENDPAKRRDLLVQFQKLAQDELPSVNLLELQHFSVLSRRVNGLSTDRDGYSKSFADVWLAAKDA